MTSVSERVSHACCLSLSGAAILIVSVGPGWAGVPVPAPLLGVTGPFGLLAAGAAYGCYRLYKHYRKHD
jgi:hypothetical protein